MSEEEPTRIGEDAGASEALRGAVDAAREDWPSETELASLEARLAPLLGPGGGGSDGGGAPSAEPGTSAAGLGGGAKTLGVIAVTAAVAGIGWWGLRGVVAPPSAPAERVTVAAPADDGPDVADEVAGPAPIPTAAPEAEVGRGPIDDAARRAPSDAAERPVRSRRPARDDGDRRPLEEAPQSPEHREPPAPAADPEAELALIRAAQDALPTAPARALASTDAHRRRFGAGVLAQEREVVAIDALIRLGRNEAARARAAAFHARWPRSAHGRRVDVLVSP